MPIDGDNDDTDRTSNNSSVTNLILKLTRGKSERFLRFGSPSAAADLARIFLPFYPIINKWKENKIYPRRRERERWEERGRRGCKHIKNLLHNNMCILKRFITIRRLDSVTAVALKIGISSNSFQKFNFNSIIALCSHGVLDLDLDFPSFLRRGQDFLLTYVFWYYYH